MLSKKLDQKWLLAFFGSAAATMGFLTFLAAGYAAGEKEAGCPNFAGTFQHEFKAGENLLLTTQYASPPVDQGFLGSLANVEWTNEDPLSALVLRIDQEDCKAMHFTLSGVSASGQALFANSGALSIGEPGAWHRADAESSGVVKEQFRFTENSFRLHQKLSSEGYCPEILSENEDGERELCLPPVLRTYAFSILKTVAEGEVTKGIKLRRFTEDKFIRGEPVRTMETVAFERVE